MESMSPVLQHTLEDSPDVAKLSASYQTMDAAKTSLSDDKALMRATALLPVGKTFMTLADKIVTEAEWSKSIVAKVHVLTAKLGDQALTDLVEFDKAVIELRTACADASVLQIITKKSADDKCILPSVNACVGAALGHANQWKDAAKSVESFVCSVIDTFALLFPAIEKASCLTLSGLATP